MSRSNRHLFGFGEQDFENLVVQNMLKFDLLDSIEDFEFRVIGDELKLFKGSTEVFSFSDTFRTQKSNIDDGTIITLGLTGSGADVEIDGSTDIGQTISNLITQDNIYIKIYQGIYTLTTTIIINNDNIKVSGIHRENTKIVSNISNDNIIEITDILGNGTNISNITICDFTIDNTTNSNTGIVGVYCNGMRNCNIRDINIQNCYTAIQVDSRNFFNDFETIRTLNCYNTVILSGTGSSYKPNQNSFSKCLFNSNVNDILNIERGNNNFFSHCSFEVWSGTAVTIDEGNGNTFVSCRFEPATGVNYYIDLTSQSTDNVFNNSYFTDNGLSWVSFDVSIRDLGEGNNVDSLNSFKSQRIRYKRRQLLNEDFVEFIRTGSGDLKSVLTLSDEYANSGNPIQLLTKSRRGTGKFISGIYDDGVTENENFYVSNNGDIFTNRYLYFNNTTTYIRNETSSNLTFNTTDLERIRITSGGNTGIGTTEPTEKIDVDGNILTRQTLKIGDPSGTPHQIQNQSDNFNFYNFYTGKGYNFYNHNSERIMTLTNDGKNVIVENILYAKEVRTESNGGGGGGFSIIDKLNPLNWYGMIREVLSPSVSYPTYDVVMKNSVGSEKLVYNTDGSFIDFQTENTPRLYIDSNGYVGIGTTSPSTLLDVNGDINTITDYNINGTQVLNSTTLGSGVINSSLQNLGTQDTSLNMGGNSITNISSVNVQNTSGGIFIEDSTNIQTGDNTTYVGDGNDLVVYKSDSVPRYSSLNTIYEMVKIRGEYDNPDDNNNNMSSSALTFYTRYGYTESSTTFTEKMRISGNGYIGIGTNSPEDDLHISSTNPGILLKGSNSSYFPYINLARNGATSYQMKNNSGNFQISQYADGVGTQTELYKYAANSHRFSTSGIERMRVDGTGVGIGTVASTTLEIADNSLPTIRITNTAEVQSTGTLGLIEFHSEDISGDGDHTLGEIYVAGTGTISGIPVTEMWFNPASGGTAVIGMVLTDSGDLFNATGVYGTISDMRVKENVVEAESQWEDMKSFDYKKFNYLNNDKTCLGLIAQEVEEISPGLIDTSKTPRKYGDIEIENMKTIKQSILYMKGMKTLQEAQLRIESLEARLTAAGL